MPRSPEAVRSHGYPDFRAEIGRQKQWQLSCRPARHEHEPCFRRLAKPRGAAQQHMDTERLASGRQRTGKGAVVVQHQDPAWSNG